MLSLFLLNVVQLSVILMNVAVPSALQNKSPAKSFKVCQSGSLFAKQLTNFLVIITLVWVPYPKRNRYILSETFVLNAPLS